MRELELWGGHECTIARRGDVWCDQTHLSGHHDRLDDLERFADLGLKALRYPVLWERVAPHHPDRCDWTWSDERVHRLQTLKLRPIAGLCHHGSGPAYVNLISDEFAPGLAVHAARTAARYPWVIDWTPVNEPLTTARFSALYGHWYPHLKDEASFWLALLNQIDAVRLSMRAIRRVIPEARLIQTEDLGRTYATDPLCEQAAFDNERRWMSWDLLFGRVTRGHFMWERLVGFGLGDRLRALADDPCPPDIIGINHYLTSDRFLDHRCDRYRGCTPGGNGREAYVDVEAVRALDEPVNSLEGALRDASARYQTPIAITEVHNGSSRDEQVRWFCEAWQSAKKLRGEGIAIEAVTAWSLLGAYDWDSLLTRSRGHYEPGAFDVSHGALRPTALAHHLRALSQDPNADHGIAGEGWWKRDVRLLNGRADRSAVAPTRPRTYTMRPILIVGAGGTLGQAIQRACVLRDLPHITLKRSDLDLTSPSAISAALTALNPCAVVNTSGWVRVDDAEEEVEACRHINTDAAICLARACERQAIPSISFSSDLVFDGEQEGLYDEDAATNPLNVYGASKADAERVILDQCKRALIIRTAAFFSPHDPHNFAAWVVRELKAGRALCCASDAQVSPTYVPSLANATLDLLLDRECGVWHLANRGALDWAAFAGCIAQATKLDAGLIEPRPRAALDWRAKRPANSALVSRRGMALPALDEAIARFAEAVAS